jgi:hypothetical protein
MIIGIKDVYLYSGLTPTGGNDSALAIQWLEENNIEFTHLWYGDATQHAGVFDAMNTWGIGTFSDFPFVVYDEVHDDDTTVRQAFNGLSEIQDSNLVELSELNAA